MDLIGRTARLEYRRVVETVSPGTEQYDKALKDLTKGDPQDEEVVFPSDDGQLPTKENPKPTDPAVLYRLGKVEMTGDALSNATAQPPQPQANPPILGWFVSFTLTPEASDRFADITRELQDKQLAIVLDKEVQSAPTIQEPITGGRGQITGDFTEQEAKDLAVVLKTGALPVELERSQVETVSATLGILVPERM